MSPQYLRRSESSLPNDQRAQRRRAAEATTQQMAPERRHCDPDMAIQPPERLTISNPGALVACIVAGWAVLALLTFIIAAAVRLFS